MLALKILSGIAALALGVWLGLPGKYQQSQADIERAMLQGGAKRNFTKRHFTPLDWFRKKKKGSDRRRHRTHFRTARSTKRVDRQGK